MNTLTKLSKILLAIVMASCIAFGQVTKEGAKFDIADFSRKFEVVQWLVEYDNVAWKTTDFLMTQDKAEIEKLGPEWFCFQDNKNNWHAVYGKLTNGKFDPIFHFVMDSTSKITRNTEKIEQEFLDSHGQALATARVKLSASIPANSPRFNQYIRRNPDKSFSVWMLPAFQTNGLAVYGGEAVYAIDKTGAKITKDESYYQQQGFRGFKVEPPREIWLNFREQEKPSLGAIFFVWYYKSYFTNIFIDNAKTTSTAIKAGDQCMWAHAEKDEKKEPSTK